MNVTQPPRYKHFADCCLFVGYHDKNDVYVCDRTLFYRDGNLPQDYTCIEVFDTHEDALDYANRLVSHNLSDLIEEEFV